MKKLQVSVNKWNLKSYGFKTSVLYKLTPRLTRELYREAILYSFRWAWVRIEIIKTVKNVGNSAAP